MLDTCNLSFLFLYKNTPDKEGIETNPSLKVFWEVRGIYKNTPDKEGIETGRSGQ